MVPEKTEVREDGLSIKWDDGHESFFPFRYLRGNCPCAVCVNEITKVRVVTEKDVPEDVRILDTDKIGNYAVTFLWSDNHYTGIYSFELLRKLCPCEKCRIKDV